jgi:hypothetical protein
VIGDVARHKDNAPSFPHVFEHGLRTHICRSQIDRNDVIEILKSELLDWFEE